MVDLPSAEFIQFRESLASLDDAERKALIERRHPEYHAHSAQWCFLEATYEGGRDWFKGNIFKYIKEGEQEYAERIERAYRFNHTREVVDLVNKYIFKGEILRSEEKASEEVKKFWQSSTLNRRPIEDFMKMNSRAASVFGRDWVCVDTNKKNPNATVLAEKEDGTRVYAYVVKPQHMLDLAYSDKGDLLWIKIREYKRDDSSITATGDIEVQYRIWTQDFWALFTEGKNDKDELIYELSDAGEHGLGRVPLFSTDHNISDNPYVATGLIDDIAYLDRAVANYLSNLDTIIQDQTFSQLVMPAQGMLPGDDSQTKLMELGLKRIFTYDAQAAQAPHYISPDASQANVILSAVNKIISEIYHSIGMAGERTKQDNSMGIDNSSGVAKAFDFDRMNSMLASKARSLEIAENTLCELVDLWFGVKVEPGTYKHVIYPETFDVRGLMDEIELAQQLLLIDAPKTVRREQMNALVDKLFPNLAPALIAAMKKEIENEWPQEEVVPPPASPPTAVVQENRQGQVTKETGNTSA